MTRSAARLEMSAAACEMEADVALAAKSDVRVLISGESGVGKQTLARRIHARGQRRALPFVAVRCAGIPQRALEWELFGDRAAAACCQTGGAIDRAQAGTLYLGQVAEAGRRVQDHLLQIIEGRLARQRSWPATDVRIIASTDVSLMGCVAAGAFREDLFYRLNVLHIAIPPVRERRSDIVVLFTRALARAAAEAGCDAPELTVEAWRYLCEYDWPGNVREMDVTARRLLASPHRGRVGPEALPRELCPPAERCAVYHV